MTRRPTGGSGTIGSGDSFLAALSHELRTPLNGVLGMAGLLARSRLDADQKAYVAAIAESGEHLLGLVNDVLDLAKLESGGFILHPVVTDLEHLLQSTAELLSPRAHAKGLEVAWAADPGLPPVMVDEGRLRQILFNLAGNAVKFTTAGGVLLTVRRVGDDAGVRLRFSVRDTGPGIEDADRERIFEAFTQGPASIGGQIESTGLGLAIVRRLADAFKGEIGLDSRPGHGSDFWFEAVFERAPERRARERSQGLQGQLVGVVTSNPLLAEGATLQVRACRGRVVLYASLAEARMAPPGTPLLVDYALQGARRPRPLAGYPCIVMLRPEERGRIPSLRKAGFSGYLIKPLRRNSLAVRILAVSGDAPAPQVQAPVEDERERAAAASGARILLAEDNPINAMLARALLEREGCAVDRVQTGPQAVEAAGAQAYDLILLDLRMPGMGGLEAAALMRSQGVTSPIAALTADAFEDTRQACLEAGMDDFLTKPLDFQALRSLLARHAPPGFTPAETQAKLAS